MSTYDSSGAMIDFTDSTATTTNHIIYDSFGGFSIVPCPASFWCRLWVVVSLVPRYLITGSVETP